MIALTHPVELIGESSQQEETVEILGLELLDMAEHLEKLVNALDEISLSDYDNNKLSMIDGDDEDHDPFACDSIKLSQYRGVARRTRRTSNDDVCKAVSPIQGNENDNAEICFDDISYDDVVFIPLKG